MSLVLLDTPVKKFAPTQISGCVLWLPADRITGLSDGDAVSSWPDWSGEGNDATQTTTANKPTYQTAELAGRPVVRFDGTDDFLECALTHDWTGEPWSVFAVADAGSPGQRYRGIVGCRFGTGAASWWSLGVITDSGGSFVLETTGGPFLDFGFDAYGEGFQLYGVITTSPASMVGYRNGVTVGTHTPGVNIGDTTNDLRIGQWLETNQIWADDIAEIIIYDSALSTADRLRVERYLNRKYNLGLAI